MSVDEISLFSRFINNGEMKWGKKQGRLFYLVWKVMKHFQRANERKVLGKVRLDVT